MTTPTTPENARFNTLIRLIVAVVIGIFLAMAAVTFIAYPRITQSSEATIAIQRNSDIIACRSALFTGVTRAQTDLDRARTHLEVVNARLFAAALANNTVDRDAAGAELNPTAQLIQAATIELETAQTKYEVGVALSRTDPDTFIAECRQGA